MALQMLIRHESRIAGSCDQAPCLSGLSEGSCLESPALQEAVSS